MTQVSEAPPKAPEIDEQKLKRFMTDLRANQNLGLAMAGGALAAFVGAGLWAFITYLTNHQIGYMAIGVGWLVGQAVSKFGRGVDPTFGIVGGAFALIGCALGNLLAMLIIVAKQEHVSLPDLVAAIPPDAYVQMMTDWFQPMDLLFYGLAVYYGYQSSFHVPTAEDMAKLQKP